MVFCPRWMQTKVFRILFFFACFHVFMILLQTGNLYTSRESNSDTDSDDHRSMLSSERFGEVVQELVARFQKDSDSVKSGSVAPDSVKSGSVAPDIRSDQRHERQTLTSEIAYETFLPGPDAPKRRKPEQIIRDILARLPDNENINFLKNYTEGANSMKGISLHTEFGNPDNFTCDDLYCYINGRTIKREIIIENPDDMFTILPPEDGFLKEFKNPCWKGKTGVQTGVQTGIQDREELLCIPYFFIIGFTKCGTTDLFAILNSHVLISSRSSKETHFFDRKRRGRGSRMHRPVTETPNRFMNWVYSGNSKYSNNLLQTFQEVDGSDVMFHGITMDATPAAVWDNEWWEVFHQGHSEPPVTNADTIAKINPKTKIIFSLRDPIKRMRSAYQFFCSIKGIYACDRPITPEKFHIEAAEAVEMFNNCTKSNTVRGCTYSTEHHQLATHLYASVYHIYVADFMAVFPRQNLYVLQFEEHIGDSVTSINKLCDFLEIPRIPEDTINTWLEKHKVRNKLKESKTIPYVLPETIEMLEKFFKPHVRDLVKLLGDEKWYWERLYWMGSPD